MKIKLLELFWRIWLVLMKAKLVRKFSKDIFATDKYFVFHMCSYIDRASFTQICDKLYSSHKVAINQCWGTVSRRKIIQCANRYQQTEFSFWIFSPQHSGMRKFIFGVYFVVIVVFAAVLIVITVLAPIEETWATFTNTISNYWSR